MSRSTARLVSAVGLLVILASVLADTIGLGEGTGLGAKQIAGIAVGAVMLVGGLVLAGRAKGSA